MAAHFQGFIVTTLLAGAVAVTGCSETKSTSAKARPAATPAGQAVPTSFTPDAPPVVPVLTTPMTFRDGEAAYHAGNFAEATTIFTRLTDEKPEHAWGHYMLALSAAKTGDVATAEKAFDEALRIDPTHVKSLVNSARLLIEQKRTDEAIVRLDKAVELEPASAATHRLFGRAYAAQGQVEEAISAYEQAIGLDEKDSWSLNNLGLLLFEQGRAADAVPLLTRAVALQKGVPAFHNNLGMALEHTGQFSAAAAAYGEALVADAGYEKAKRNLSRVEGRKDRPSAEAVVATPAVEERGNPGQAQR